MQIRTRRLSGREVRGAGKDDNMQPQKTPLMMGTQGHGEMERGRGRERERASESASLCGRTPISRIVGTIVAQSKVQIPRNQYQARQGEKGVRLRSNQPLVEYAGSLPKRKKKKKGRRRERAPFTRFPRRSAQTMPDT